MPKKNRARARGFTLVELIISTGIIALISGIFLANYHQYKTNGNLAMSAAQLASDLRRTQNFALGLKEYAPNQVPTGGWGMFLEKNANKNNYYILYKDINGDHAEAGAEDYGNKIYFPNGITITAFSTPGNTINITYEPPNPTVWICWAPGTGSCDTNVTITLANNTGQSKNIKINKFGLIDIAQ